MPRTFALCVFLAGIATAITGFVHPDTHVAALGVVLMFIGFGGCLMRA